MSPQTLVAVLVAGAVGALARYGISLWLARFPKFPAAVLSVNVLGSALGGSALGLAAQANISAAWHLILVTGLAGGLTTFSTWSVETMQLLESGRVRTAIVSVALNLVLGAGVATLAYLLFA